MSKLTDEQVDQAYLYLARQSMEEQKTIDDIMRVYDFKDGLEELVKNESTEEKYAKEKVRDIVSRLSKEREQIENVMRCIEEFAEQRIKIRTLLKEYAQEQE